MTYYGSWATENNTAERLIRDGDGICFAWTDLLLETLKAGGIAGDARQVLVAAQASDIVPGLLQPEGFLINTWEFETPNADPASNQSPLYHYLNTYKDVFYADNDYAWTYAQARYTVGTPGQGGVAKPPALFQRHGLVKMGDTYFDPSYGKTYTGADDFKTQVVSGFWIRRLAERYDESAFGLEGGIDLNGSGAIEDDASVSSFSIAKSSGVFSVKFT
jgi:hypothetical protein